MTPPTRSPVESYVDELAAALPRGRAARDLLDEVREHLHEATAAGESAGLARDDAEREAVRSLGSVADLAPQFRTAAIVCDARRQVGRQLLGALLLGLARAPRTWQDGRWLAWLVRARAVASWLFQLGMAACAALLASPLAMLSDAPHQWSAAGALGGHLVASFLVPLAGACRLLAILDRWR